MSSVPGKTDWSETKDANENTQDLCNLMKGDVEKMTGKKYTQFKAVKYRTGPGPRGEITLIKVNVGEDYDHLSIFQGMPFLTDVPPPKLRGVLQHRSLDDSLVPFTN
ncbi:cystatin-B-like [Plectropomus leopardus]|uniref:cystatin-B-like n=1 Tax=Plectropomus leopardus TaxID=160734 RepID=UPI001C4B7502|nr:cystatin-B-like [Plectropomus leopardus]